MISVVLNGVFHVLLLSAVTYFLNFLLKRINLRSSTRYIFLKLTFLTLPLQAFLFQADFPSFTKASSSIIVAKPQVSVELPAVDLFQESTIERQRVGDVWTVLATVLLVLLLVGLCYSLLKVLYSFRSLARIKERAEPQVIDGSVVYVHNESLSPAAFGIINPVVLVPERLIQDLTNQELKMVIDHEVEHIKKYDPLFNVLRHIVEAVLFFSPFVKKLSRLFEEEMELALDESLLKKSLVVKREYGNLLINLCSMDLSPDPIVCNGLSQKLLRRRVVSMKNMEKMSASRKVLVGALGVIVCVGLLTPFLGINVEVGAFDSSAAAKKVNLDYFLVNLSGSDGNKLFKAEMDFEVDSSAVKNEIESHMSQVRDVIIVILSQKKFQDIATAEGKENLRQDIKAAVNSFLLQGKITNVFFTRFIFN
ncbi:MAG: flagellar basal body-associated FliL family protein [Bdellovibrionales bacterium]|nr:flagellar basal body-associated FliL family protein [Bdellovibrionales bacterium]NQZ19213.1 flagellar basal body-associated FliL family protein [Bdellovibrionales bacterium]